MPEIVVKKILASQPLLVEPRDDSDQVVLNGVPLRVFAGEKVKTGAKSSAVETVNGVAITWVFIEATGGLNVDKRKGFVDDKFLVDESTSVEEPGGFQPFPVMVSRDDFADACYVQAELNKTNPAYLYALAFAQSGGAWTDDEVRSENAFGFTTAIWTDLLKLPELSDLSSGQIKRPTAQIIVAAVLAAKSANLLKGLITDRGLSAVDLYLAHIFADDKSFGSNAAARLLDAEKADKTSKVVIGQIYQDDALRDACIQRNEDVFGANGSTTIEQALANCTSKLAAGFKEVEKVAHEIQKSIPANVDDPILGIRFNGNVIAVTDQDVDALARVSQSEVGNFGMFGQDVLADALGAVVDTIFNRSIHPSKEFPKTIQGVIDQPEQFSAINSIGTWRNLPAAPAAHFQLVLAHIQNRVRGTASQIKGATHFFNPDTSHPDWGEPIRENPVAVYGKPKNSHIHGFPKNYRPPEGHAIQLGKDAWVFSGDGVPQGPLIAPDKSSSSIVAAALKEWDFWGKSVIPGGIHHTDDELAFATYVRDTYCKPFSAHPSIPDIQNDVYFWSAVAISYMVRQAGLSASEFTFSEMHSTYIRESIRARKAKDASKAYWGFRIDDPEAILAPGDIVGAGRTKGMTFDQAQALYDRTDDYESHSDIVVEVRAGAADVIGGNVSDSVTRKTLQLDAKGRIRDKKNLSFVVMKKN
jgi:spore germination cell wall hydrolase CwlJ-like protein